jgi:superfamily II DNA or RNA helicase
MTRTLAVLPTGTGKTVCFAHVAKAWIDAGRGRALIVAHREELIQQAADKVLQVTGVHADIEMGESRADQCSLIDQAPIVITSVQTMCRPNRHGRFDPQQFGLLIIDEAHHATAPTYKRLIEHFAQNPALRILGVTATPDRHDEEALGQIFETVAYEYEIQTAIEDGYLVPIEQQFVQVEGLDLSQCRTKGDDLNEGDLAKIMGTEKNLHGVVDPALNLAGDQPTLFFMASVAHAERGAEIANRHRPESAVCLHGKTPRDERRGKLKAFSRGEFQYLFNCGLFLEGFDETSIAVVAMARPTKSRALYAQAVGRGPRPLPGLVDGLDDAASRRRAIAMSNKPGLLVLDFVGNSGRHKLVSTADILGGNFSDEEVELASNHARNKSARGEKTDMLRELLAAREEIEEEAKRKRAVVVAKAKFRSQSVDPFDVFDIAPRREQGWFKGKRPTDKQIATLQKFKVPDKQIDALSFGAASQLLDTLIGRMKQGKCSYKQAALLRKHGYSPDLSRTEASAIIDTLAQNGWRRPVMAS